MPLIHCTECGQQISTEAEACPQCGHPNRRTPPAAPRLATQCKTCAQPAVGSCKACGGFYCASHGGLASFGLNAPICSACYDANRPQVGCRAVFAIGLGIFCLILGGALASSSSAGGGGVLLALLGLLIFLGAVALAWTALRRFP
jgi:hypothetical protein